MTTKDWSSIPRFPVPVLENTINWSDVESIISQWHTDYNIDLNPDFQSQHAWSVPQQKSWVEFSLSGGDASHNITFVTDQWGPGSRPSFFVLTDGKQRLYSVRQFMSDQLPVFPDHQQPSGYTYSQFTGTMTQSTLHFRVFLVPSMAAALRLYLGINIEGTPHTQTDLNSVRQKLVMELTR